MVPSASTKVPNVEEQDIEIVGTGLRLVDYIPISISQLDDPPSQQEEETTTERKKQRRLLDLLKAHPSSEWLRHSGFVGRLSPFAFLRRRGHHEGLRFCHNRRRFRVPFTRKEIDWKALLELAKQWAKDPANAALVAWLLVVGAGLLLLFLVISGILNGAIPESSVRKRWAEIINQILNALFTIMCLYQHPRLVHHLFLLLRWSPKDSAELRATYCGYTAARPRERAHLSLVVVLLHATCGAQYVLCGLYWGYTSKTRPDAGLVTCIVFGIAMPIVAALYTFCGPLGWKQEKEEQENSERPISITGRFHVGALEERAVVAEPEWAGGLLDCGDDAAVGCASLWCTFCVFGWNAERMGFGNMYVHVATFWLLCFAPLLLFAVAGMHVDDEGVRYAVWGSGVVLCFLGLMYGGYWRGRTRRRFGLPAGGRGGRRCCCCRAWVGDCAAWLLCWWCALAQEVRTANYYEIEEDSFCGKGEGVVEPKGGVAARSWSERMVRIEVKWPVRSRSCPGEILGSIGRDGSLRLVGVEEGEGGKEEGGGGGDDESAFACGDGRGATVKR